MMFSFHLVHGSLLLVKSGKLPAGFGLGNELRMHRKRAGLTQPQLAQAARIAERTVRGLERGNGTLETWNAALESLTLTVTGRNLPGGETLRERLVTLRRRKRLSQQELAQLVGVTKPTIGALEREGKGRVQTLQSVLTVLGAGAYLAPKDVTAAFYTHAGNSSVDQGWETPPELLEALNQVFPRFDLDPCSPRKTKTKVRARTHYTAEDDGLSLPWFGTVFVNPPYGRTLAAWIAKSREEVESGRARTVIALLPARPDTRYWHKEIAGKATVYFLRGRLRFSGSEQSAPFPSALVVWGANPETLSALDAALPEAWRVD